MFARVFTAQIQPDKINDIIALVQNSIIPAAKAQSGFVGLVFLTDAALGKVKLISQWATEADRTASENNGFLREQLAKLSAFVAGPPSTERFVVSCQS